MTVRKLDIISQSDAGGRIVMMGGGRCAHLFYNNGGGRGQLYYNSGGKHGL